MQLNPSHLQTWLKHSHGSPAIATRLQGCLKMRELFVEIWLEIGINQMVIL